MLPFLAAFRVFGLHTARVVAKAVAIVLGIGLLAGGIRLLPWLVSKTLPARVALPFASGLFSAALEAAFLVGLPVGFALASALFVERNEARSLFALGIGPARIVASTAPLALLLVLLTALSSWAWGREASAPGRLARVLVSEARAGCLDLDRGARAVEVPFVSATWLCQEGDPPRLVARLRGTEAVFTASAIEIDDRLAKVAATDLRLSLPSEAPARLRVARSTLRGLEPFARSSRLSPWARALLVSTTAGVLALLAGWAILRFGGGGRVEALIFGGSGPIVVLGGISLLDRMSVTTLTYLVIPAAAVVTIFAVLAIRGCVPERSLR